jgi:hypothetical protein
MASETLIKCGHPPCQCLVEAELHFCSATCASARGAARGACACGHAGCTAESSVKQDPGFDPANEESELDSHTAE